MKTKFRPEVFTSETDFSATDRRKMLNKIPQPKKPRNYFVAPNLLLSKVWMQDVSLLDRRSIKAQLAGQGDFRSLLWHVKVTFKNCSMVVYFLLMKGLDMKSKFKENIQKFFKAYLKKIEAVKQAIVNKDLQRIIKVLKT